MPQAVKGVFPHNWLKEKTRSRNKERYEISWDPRDREEKPYAVLRRPNHSAEL